MSERYDVVVVGGGLSGLAVAAQLSANVSYVLLEAHPNQLGGRLRNSSESDGIVADLGGAWVWSHQRRVMNLLSGLGLKTFAQPDDASSTRIREGAHKLISALAGQIESSDRVRMGWALKSCERDMQTGDIVLKSAGGETVRAGRVVLAIPPKLLAETVSFTPALSPRRWQAMQRSRTWMAGVTKVLLVFPERFWKLGFSSNMGMYSGPRRPAFQVYDGGGDRDETSPAALTFFTVAPPKESVGDAELAQLCARQLSEVWSSMFTFYGDAEIERLKSGYTSYIVQRWPLEEYISDDPMPTKVHPHPEPNDDLGGSEWGGRLIFSGTEAAQREPGVMEGALDAAHAAAALLGEIGDPS